ncbi:MAG: hypothetical protein GXY15_05860 [Candidatus Hydrogenedentes bacterium]|nr:hypothetical protein [Candidatus Hydrogenedentota bacterium]
MTFRRGVALLLLCAGSVVAGGCRDIPWGYDDSALRGRWYLAVGGPFTIAENRYLDFRREGLVYVYPERTQDLLNDLLVTLPAGFPSTYSVSLKGPYVVDEDRQPSFIDYAVEEVEVSLDTLQVSMENYLRPMSVHERSQFFSSMAQKLGAGRISDVPGLLKAMSLYQEEKFLAAYAPGFFGLYDVYQCDLLLQMGLGARPEVMDNPLTFNHETCN